LVGREKEGGVHSTSEGGKGSSKKALSSRKKREKKRCG